MNPLHKPLNELPKVLIVGFSFRNVGGGGITMTNLFKGWPKDSIAVAASDIIGSGLESCLIYYRIGFLEEKRIWPLHYIQPKYPSGPLVFSPQDIKQDFTAHQTSTSRYNPLFKRTVMWLLHFFGVYFFQNRLRISDTFLKWIQEYQPDIIYSQLESYELIKFMQALKKKTNIPMAIHFMDDWPKSIVKAGIFYPLWKLKMHHEIKKLLKMSEVHLSICDAMSREYESRYDQIFKAFHNPIQIDQWLPYSKQNWTVNGTFRIIYTGRIGTANGKSVIEISRVIDGLCTEGIKIQMDIFSPDGKRPIAEELKNLKGIRILEPVPHVSIPTLLPSYDLAVLPLDFDKEGIKFAQFSMPTKASEYMISATPVLVYADKRTALAQYAADGKWAFLVTEHKASALKTALMKLIEDASLREILGKTARELSIKNENAETVVQQFRNTLSECKRS